MNSRSSSSRKTAPTVRVAHKPKVSRSSSLQRLGSVSVCLNACHATETSARNDRPRAPLFPLEDLRTPVVSSATQASELHLRECGVPTIWAIAGDDPPRVTRRPVNKAAAGGLRPSITRVPTPVHELRRGYGVQFASFPSSNRACGPSTLNGEWGRAERLVAQDKVDSEPQRPQLEQRVEQPRSGVPERTYDAQPARMTA